MSQFHDISGKYPIDKTKGRKCWVALRQEIMPWVEGFDKVIRIPALNPRSLSLFSQQQLAKVKFQ